MKKHLHHNTLYQAMPKQLVLDSEICLTSAAEHLNTNGTTMIPNIIEPSSSITLASTWATQRITKLSNHDIQKYGVP